MVGGERGVGGRFVGCGGERPVAPSCAASQSATSARGRRTARAVPTPHAQRPRRGAARDGGGAAWWWRVRSSNPFEHHVVAAREARGCRVESARRAKVRMSRYRASGRPPMAEGAEACGENVGGGVGGRARATCGRPRDATGWLRLASGATCVMTCVVCHRAARRPRSGGRVRGRFVTAVGGPRETTRGGRRRQREESNEGEGWC